MATPENYFDLVVPQYVILIIFATVSSSLSLGNYNPLPVGIAIVSLSLAVFGLNAFNQVFDVEIDKASKKGRPIVLGALSRKKVLVFSIACFLASLAIAAAFAAAIVSVVLFFVFLSVIYSAPPIRLKRFGIMSNAVGGTLYGALPFLCASAISGNFVLIYFFFFYGITIFLATMKDFEDMEAEKKLGIRTLPVLLGARRAKQLVDAGIFFVIAATTIAGAAVFGILQAAPGILCLVLLYKFCKIGFDAKEKVTSQSRSVTKAMLVIALMELVFGAITAFLMTYHIS